ncbi:MAG: long-chain fatty acid--CoA ligase [Proteobacteria bacterium]|nr:long-chain fatty acid--CoA ligase [Pseudomonadota bacterium]MBU1696055.1 long-chain fatty acid--CoA ligase [Pseudomonadota bacterium]
MENTINQVFRNRTRKYQDRLAIEKKRDGKWQTASWNQYYERARATGLALGSLGAEKGDRIALLSENRLEWLYTDMGALGIGCCVVPVYATLTADEVAYIIDNSDSRILVVEDGVQLAKALQILDRCPSLAKVVVMNAGDIAAPHPSVISFDTLLATGRSVAVEKPDLFEELADSVKPEELATIVYTSGTTGVPKGAMITHKNIMAVLLALDAIEPKFATETDFAVPFLPLSHVFERAAGHYYGMYVGITSSYAENINTLLVDFKEKRPTMILAVPRVCEKVYQKIIMQVEQQPAWRQKIFHWGHAIGTEISALREKKLPIPFLMRLKYRLAYKLIFQKLREALGGRVRWMTASGAPTAREIVLFFNAAGIMVVEGYGMTECFAPATMSNLADYRIGTVGRPLPGVDIKIAEDGEILVGGDNVFKGYWKMEAETRDSFDENGYFISGDIGKFDDAGFLMITDRKKNLIITSGGKNIAPQKIESVFISDPLFAHFMVIGDNRKYLSAIITINMERAEILAAKNGIAYGESQELLDNPDFLAIVDEHVQKKNTGLARFETIKKYRIIKQEFTQDTGELTPSLKLKRKVVQKMYSDEIESLYTD